MKQFPESEKFGLSSQMQRAAVSVPANVAEGWNNKHINIYLEGINRALGELRETKHHLFTAFKKRYLAEELYRNYLDRYEECGRMLRGLEQALERKKT